MANEVNLINNTQSSNCKFCGSTHVRKYGLYKGVQRYFCNDCGSKFKNDDMMFHMKTDTNLVSTALSAYYEGMPIRAISGTYFRNTGKPLHLPRYTSGYRTPSMPLTA